MATERTERFHLEQVIKSQNGEKDALSKQINDLKETLKSLGFSNNELKKDSELRDLKDKLEQKIVQIQNLKAEIAKKVKRLSELDAKHDEKIKEKEKEIATLQADLKAQQDLCKDSLHSIRLKNQ